jgi:hypothetical protein
MRSFSRFEDYLCSERERGGAAEPFPEAAPVSKVIRDPTPSLTPFTSRRQQPSHTLES